jgi:hypothetical protein
VLSDAANEVIGYADVEGAADAAGEDIDAIAT